jgi:UDP-2-acetamido-3-amino-2,3-dideoxy-glucuronate N-acetyltransferase
LNTKNIAVIGAGYWGKNLVRNFHELGVLKTVCDGAQTVRKQISEGYPGVSVIDDMDSVIKDGDIQGVVIAAPAALHYQLAEKALRADKHVFVEKPLSLTYEDGKKLVALAHEKGKILFVGHILHYHAAVIKLKEMVRAGRVGRLQYIYSRRLSLGKIRREENILWSFAPHDISLILCVVGEDPHYIDAVGNNFLHAQIPDVTMTNIKFPSGIGAHIFVSWLNPFKEQRLVIVGSQGMLVFDDTQAIDQKLVLYPHTINWKNGIPTPEKAEAEAIRLSEQWEEPLKAECRAFLDAITTGQHPLTNGEEGLRVLRILEACQDSIEEKEKGGRPHPSTLTKQPSPMKTLPSVEAQRYGTSPTSFPVPRLVKTAISAKMLLSAPT